MARAAGYNTRQYSAVLGYLSANPGRHITVAGLQRSLCEAGTPIGTATLYRQLDRLEAQGLVRKYRLGEGQAGCYEYTGGAAGCGGHLHLKCEGCGRLIHLECAHLLEVQQHVSESHGFTVDPSKTIFYGRCAGCRSGEDEQP